jgi:hypothetical protein
MDGIERNNKNPKNNKIDINYTNITKALTQFSNVLEKEMGSKSKNFDISKIKTQIEKCLNTTFAVVDEKIESLQTGLGTIFKAVTEVNEKSKITPTKTPEAIKRAAEKVSTSLTKSSNNKTPGNSWNKGVSNNTSYLRSNSVSKSPGNSWNKGVSNNTSYLRSNSVSKTISSNNSFSNSPTNKRYNSVGNNIKLSLRDTYKSPSKTTSYNRFNPSKSTTTSSFGGLNNNPVYSKTTNNFLNRIKNNIKKTGQSGVSYNGMSNGKFKFTIKNKSKTGFSSFGSLGNNYKNCKNYAKRSLNITNVYKKGNPPKTR